MGRTVSLLVALLVATPALAEPRHGEVVERGEHLVMLCADADVLLANISGDNSVVLRALVGTGETVFIEGTPDRLGAFLVTGLQLPRTQRRYHLTEDADGNTRRNCYYRKIDAASGALTFNLA